MDYLALILFVLVTCITPGPNNIMMMTSGINHGLKRSIPHMAGINLGFPLMIILVGLGFSAVFDRYPLLFTYLKAISTFYLLYIAYGILMGSIASSSGQSKKPMSLFEAALFQWVNPKAWVMALGALAAFINYDAGYLSQTLYVALIFMIFGTPCTAVWLLSGVGLKKLLNNPFYLKLFNISMATLLIISMAPTLKEVSDFVMYRI